MEPYSNEAKRQAYSADHDGSIPSGSLRGDTTLKTVRKGRHPENCISGGDTAS